MEKSVRIVPAVLTDDPGALATMLRQAESFTGYVQVDIMDGHFVPSRSITDRHLALIPTVLRWEAHLMIERPEDYLGDYLKAGATKVVFHYEATSNPGQTITCARELGMEVGLALNPETAVAAVRPLLNQVDSVLLLTVNPGFYGSPFIPEVLGKVAQLRHARSDIRIGVDGGIKESNVALIAGMGAQDICVGSAIFQQPQPGESYRHLLALAREGAGQ